MTPEEMNEKVTKLQNDVLEKATESARLMSDMVQAYDRQNRRLWVAVLALAACLVITAGCMIWAVQNAQRVANEAVSEAISTAQETMNEAVLNALETVAEMEVVSETTTTTQTVEGDSAIINNSDFDQYNDNATNQGGGN